MKEMKGRRKNNPPQIVNINTISVKSPTVINGIMLRGINTFEKLMSNGVTIKYDSDAPTKKQPMDIGIKSIIIRHLCLCMPGATNDQMKYNNIGDAMVRIMTSAIRALINGIISFLLVTTGNIIYIQPYFIHLSSFVSYLH